MKRIKRWIACMLVLSCLVPGAMAERLEDSVLYSFYDGGFFFGDSNLQNFRRYISFLRQTDEDFLNRITLVCASGISLYMGSRPFLAGDYRFTYRGAESTMYEIARKYRVKKVFILLGQNDPVGKKVKKALSWAEDIIKFMPDYTSDTEIYFFSETPVTSKYLRTRKSPDYQENLDEYNRGLKEICERNGAHYIELAASLKGEDNCLDPALSSDGICHLNDEGIEVWLQCMRDYAQEQYELGLWDPFVQAEAGT